MDALIPQLRAAHSKLGRDDGIHWIPVRHHSPACAFHLCELLRRLEPDIVLIEGPVDFNRQLNALGHPDTETPVALYGGIGFFPLCATSPEWVALRWATENRRKIHFIDLPIKDKAWRRERRETGGVSFIREARLQHSEFIQALVKKSGCRNSDELWERWFELADFDTAEAFFLRVFDYCASARLTYSPEAIADSEDASREAFMRARMRRYAEPGKITFVITGGFHTYGLLDWADDSGGKSVKAAEKCVVEDSWLIRYSQDRLDADNGYSAGMPAPDFYERIFNSRRYSSNPAGKEFILDCLAMLDTHDDFFYPIHTAAKIAICEQALNLSRLRGHVRPGLFDLLDAIKSVLIKHESSDDEPLLAKARALFGGNRLGRISIDQPPLPLVNDLWQRLKSARFKLDTTVKVTTDIALYQNKNRQRLALLYQCQFLELDFAEKVAGPDWIRGVNLHLRHEQWRYAWTPRVEARLADLSPGAASWELLLETGIRERERELADRALWERQQLLVQLVLMDNLHLAPGIWSSLNSAIDESTDCEQLSQLLFLLMRLRHTENAIFDRYSRQLSALVGLAWQQLMFSLPHINQGPIDEGLRVLLRIQELTREFEGYLNESWKTLWINRLLWLAEHGELSPGILFACKALLVDLDQGRTMEVLAAIESLFDADEESAYQALYAVMNVSPHWLKRSDRNSLLAILNRLMIRWDDDRFLRALPQLRFLFSHLDPAMIETISHDLCRLNGWERAPDVFDAEVDETQLLQAQRLQNELMEQLRKEGLEHWITR